MLSKQAIAAASTSQMQKISSSTTYSRELLPQTSKFVPEMATIITGIRRCGKSTLLGQMVGSGETPFYLNFDSPSLYGFGMSDFELLDELLEEYGSRTLLLDEVQVVEGWEVYARSALDRGLRVCITGSNAHLLSRELGTKLTGRHISYELFPFSYSEYCGFKSINPCELSLKSYLDEGGMPKYIETGDDRVLEELVNDILYRDIAVRHRLRDERAAKSVLALLLSNVGGYVSAVKLKNTLGIGSTTTVSEYLSFFQESYLLEFVPKFSYSLKAQISNPKKIYCIDNGIVSVVSRSFSANYGHKLENATYLALRRMGVSPYYFNEGGHECDFIVTRFNIPETALQVWYDLDAENRDRELSGLVAAMDALNIGRGAIVTFSQKDEILFKDKRIKVIPFDELVNLK